MNLLKFYTTRINLRDSLAVRRWGIVGARRFWLGWGAFLYAFLVLASGYLFSSIAQQAESTERHIFYLAAALIVIAASLLTGMLTGVLAELRALESSDKTEAETQ